MYGTMVCLVVTFHDSLQVVYVTFGVSVLLEPGDTGSECPMKSLHDRTFSTAAGVEVLDTSFSQHLLERLAFKF